MKLIDDLKQQREEVAERKDRAVMDVTYFDGRLADLDRAIAALTPAPVQAEPGIPEGFTKWVDSGNRFTSATVVDVVFRSGRQATHTAGELANFWDTLGEQTDIIAYRIISEPAAGEGVDDGEAMRAAHSIMPGSGATFKTDEEIRESVRPHASDCARNNEPAYPAGKCDCTLRLKWTRYSEIAPKAPDELAGYEVQSHYSDEHGEWVYRHVPKAVAAGVDPFTIGASKPHAEESAALAPLLPPEPPKPATPEEMMACGYVNEEASWWNRKLAKATNQ